MSYIRTLLPRFSSARYDDGVAIARILCAVHRTPQRIAKFGFIDYKQDSVLSLVRTYYKYLKANPILTDDDKIILHSDGHYRDWETDRKSTRLNSSHSAKSRMPSSA